MCLTPHSACSITPARRGPLLSHCSPCYGCKLDSLSTGQLIGTVCRSKQRITSPTWWGKPTRLNCGYPQSPCVGSSYAVPETSINTVSSSPSSTHFHLRTVIGSREQQLVRAGGCLATTWPAGSLGLLKFHLLKTNFLLKHC
jgi:hypothetical protein